MSGARRAAFALILTSAAATGCTYSPNPVSGTLGCGPNRSCPDDYVCASDNTCWKKGQVPSGTGGTTGTGGTGGRGGSGGGSADAGGPADKFLGHWVFGAGSTLTQTCSGMTDTAALAGDYVDVSVGLVGDLSASYFCDWELNINGNSTTILPGQACSYTDPTDNTTYSWTGSSFALTTTNGSTASLTASLPFTYANATTSGLCSLSISGSLTKSP